MNIYKLKDVTNTELFKKKKNTFQRKLHICDNSLT